MTAWRFQRYCHWPLTCIFDIDAGEALYLALCKSDGRYFEKLKPASDAVRVRRVEVL